MEIQEALAVIRKLADGMHPETGAVLPSDCLYHHPQAEGAAAAPERLPGLTRLP